MYNVYYTFIKVINTHSKCRKRSEQALITKPIIIFSDLTKENKVPGFNLVFK